MRHLAQARNPYSRSWLWIPGSRYARPQMRNCASGNDELINRRLTDRRSKTGLKEIEIATFIGLLDVPGEHPAIAALKTALRRLPFGAAFGQFRLRHIEVDGAGVDVERDAVAVLHQ